MLSSNVMLTAYAENSESPILPSHSCPLPVYINVFLQMCDLRVIIHFKYQMYTIQVPQAVSMLNYCHMTSIVLCFNI